MKRTLIGTTALAGILIGGAYWAGQDDTALINEANAAQDQNVGGTVVLLKLAVPAGDEVGDVVRKDAVCKPRWLNWAGPSPGSWFLR